MNKRYMGIGLGLFVFTSCAGAPRPVDQLADTEAALRAAREIGASDYPKGELHIRLAQEQLQHANELMDDGENHRAKRALERAKADAEYAVALTRCAKAEQALETAQAKQPKSEPLSMSER
jgi:hypothetical protein